MGTRLTTLPPTEQRGTQYQAQRREEPGGRGRGSSGRRAGLAQGQLQAPLPLGARQKSGPSLSCEGFGLKEREVLSPHSTHIHTHNPTHSQHTCPHIPIHITHTPNTHTHTHTMRKHLALHTQTLHTRHTQLTDSHIHTTHIPTIYTDTHTSDKLYVSHSTHKYTTLYTAHTQTHTYKYTDMHINTHVHTTHTTHI